MQQTQQVVIYKSQFQASMDNALQQNPEFILGFFLWAALVLFCSYFFLPVVENIGRKYKINVDSVFILGIIMAMSAVLVYIVFN